MAVSERELLEIELDAARYQLRSVMAPERQTAPTEEGRAYREKLERDIRELEQRLASEEE